MSAPSTAVDLRDVLAGVPTGLFIAGRWRGATSGRIMPVENPATRQILTHVADAGVEDAQAAVTAAAAAQNAWAATPPRMRSDILRLTYERITARTDELAAVMTAEMGKPLAEARGEVTYGAEFFRWFSEEATRLNGSYGTTPDGRTRMITMRRPVGPCLLITPWNFPLAMGARKIAPAIAAGCTIVFKPAPQTPLTALLLTDILHESGLPDGVLNVITTSQAADVIEPVMCGGVLRKLSFTGSTAVGKTLLEHASHTVMRTSMELGGNAAFIVFDDADLDTAVEAAFAAKMRNMGEACTAANRIYVQHGIAEQFTAALSQRMSALVVGDGLRDGVQVGPLIDAPSHRKITGLVQDAVAHGATIVGQADLPDGDGYFYPPTVLFAPGPDSRILRTEIFGPVATVIPFDTEDDVVQAANGTPWGLVGYVATRDLNRALRVAERLEVGMVGINTGIVSNPAAPFGGVKESGLGREGGHVGIEEYLEYRYVAIPAG
ncbi:NAD-dependent succinate-semialdehyde dehydrogenase [Dactylosporangium sp. NPDC050588]|uniref:NAD-dependent succinate-semialdehyde dehydrogenase n=1 Tax=Dactylosporangium sp. NPDC050588 TaxID=3157211 RepID=UPI0033F44C35